jgi:hypothetical protein
MIWDQVHAGDTVRGADQRTWEVVGRKVGPRWLSGAAQDVFTMRLGEREVTTAQELTGTVALVARADHSESARAWDVLTSNGFQLIYLGEGPMTDPFATPAGAEDGIKRDRYGRYVLPHPLTGKETAFTRVTTLARTLADEYGLNQWAKRNVAKGMGLRSDLVVAAAAADPDEDKGTLASIVEQAEQAAGAKRGANLGTAFHQSAKRLDGGESLKSIGLPAPVDADLATYERTLKKAGLKVIPAYMERIVFVPLDGMEVCGTLDRIYQQPPGVTKSEPFTVGDLKSGKDLDYSWLEIEIQQACYSRATFMWDKEKGHWIALPVIVDQSRALVIHCPIGKAQTTIYGVNLIEGWRKAKLAVDVRAARKSAKGWLVLPQDFASVAHHLVSQADSKAEIAELWDRFHPDGQWTEEVNAAAFARIEYLQARAELNHDAAEAATWK